MKRREKASGSGTLMRCKRLSNSSDSFKASNKLQACAMSATRPARGQGGMAAEVASTDLQATHSFSLVFTSNRA